MKDRYVIDTEPVKSSTYMLPILDEQIDFEFLPLMVGSYIYNNRDDKEFSVLYKFKGSEKFTEFEKRMMDHVLFIGHEDYGEYVLYKFRLTAVMQKALDLLLDGKYSLLTLEQKNCIESMCKRRGFSNYRRIRMILDKHESIKLELEFRLKCKISWDAELSSPIDPELEYFSDRVKKIEINTEQGEDIYESNKEKPEIG
tara:strand:- start:103 stop:699 length:597 start_codon:yes stop_codon:yes gene_type:complete